MLVSLFTQRQRSQRTFLALSFGVLITMMSGCSSINQLEKTKEVMDTLQEADRQFAIENTPFEALPNDGPALTWIDRAITLMPHSDVPYVGDGTDPGIIAILEDRCRYPLLIRLLKTAVADPKLSSNPDLLLSLADAEERMGPKADASKYYALAVSAINKSMSKPGTTFDPESGLLLLRAQAEYYGGLRPQAVKDFQEVIATDPDLAAEAQNNLAYFYSLDKTNLPEALTLSEAAVASARKNGDETVIGTYEDTLAWVKHDQGDDKQALFYEQEAASLVPLMPDVQYHLGVISQATGEDLVARSAFIRAIKADPFNADARASYSSLPATSQLSDASQEE